MPKCQQYFVLVRVWRCFPISYNNYNTQIYFSDQLYLLGIPPSLIVETHTVVAVFSFLLHQVNILCLSSLLQDGYCSARHHNCILGRWAGEGLCRPKQRFLLSKILFTICLPGLFYDHLFLEVAQKSSIQPPDFQHVVLKVQSSDWQHQHHLRPCQKCKFFCSALDLLLGLAT